MVMQKERASKKQQELLSFVDGFIKGNGYGPSYREIMLALGYKSVSTVAIHVDSLIAKGYLARRDKSARSLEVVSLRPSEPKAAVASLDIEAELRNVIAKSKFDEKQRATIGEAMELLGFEKLAQEMKPKEVNE